MLDFNERKIKFFFSLSCTEKDLKAQEAAEGKPPINYKFLLNKVKLTYIS